MTPCLKRKFSLAAIVLLGAFLRLHLINALPPAAGFDPAYYGVDALKILDGARPIYLATNFGREALFSYLVAGAFWVVGPGALGIRLTSAVVGILTLPAVYILSKEFLRLAAPRLAAGWPPLLTTALVAVSFWHLMWSRYSVRAILIPFFFALTFFFALRALRLGRRRDFVLTGVWLGGGFYTYQLGQVLPILVLALFVLEGLARPGRFSRQQFGRRLLTFGAAFVVVLPLVAYMFQNPGVYNRRLDDVLVINQLETIGDQLDQMAALGRDVAKMYVWEGDGDPQINLPGRPVLNPLLALGLILGLLIALWRWRRWPYLLLLGWLALFALPAMVADSAALSKRTLGELPAVFLLITLGLAVPAEWLRRRFLARRRFAWLLAAAIVLISAGITYRDFFLRWGQDPALYTHYNAGVAAAGRYIAQLPTQERVYLSPIWGEHAALLLNGLMRPDIRDFNGRHCFVFPAETPAQIGTTYVVVPRDEQNSSPLLERYFPGGRWVYDGVLPNGEPYFRAYRIPPQTTAAFEPAYPLDANFDNRLQLLGVDVSQTTARPGEEIAVTLYARPLRPIEQDFTVFIHLLGPANPFDGSLLWGQRDREPCYQSYPTSRWREGEIIRDTFVLQVSPEAPPGEYALTAGFYKWPELTRLPLAGGGDTVHLHTIAVSE